MEMAGYADMATPYMQLYIWHKTQSLAIKVGGIVIPQSLPVCPLLQVAWTVMDRFF